MAAERKDVWASGGAYEPYVGRSPSLPGWSSASGYVEEWYYKTPEMAEYKRIPNDIIHWGETAPYGLPTLFVYNGEEICFWPPNGAI